VSAKIAEKKLAATEFFIFGGFSARRIFSEDILPTIFFSSNSAKFGGCGV